MDVFSFRDRVVEDYGQFSRSFTQIKAPDLRDFVDGRYGAGEYWPSPLIQLNPSFVGGGSIGSLVEEGLLHPECSRIFRWGKDQGEGVELQLHRHQRDAIEIARSGGSLVVISGTGSGKSLGYLIPMINRVLEAREKKIDYLPPPCPRNSVSKKHPPFLQHFPGTLGPFFVCFFRVYPRFFSIFLEHWRSLDKGGGR